MKKVLIALTLTFSTSVFACQGDKCANGLAFEAYGPAKANNLAIFVHGDVSSGGSATYMQRHARQFAENNPNTVAVSLVRPGYDDGVNTSAGTNYGRRDSYTAGNNAAVAGAISALKKKFGAKRVIALGHSGGAATLGTIAGTRGGLLQGVVLVSCPCDITAWRAARGGAWTQSQSPINYIGGLSGKIVLVTGSGDNNTTPALAEDYAAKAKARGKNASAQIVGGGHDFGGGLSSISIQALSEMVR